jgi:hypothetical protein
LASCQKGWFGRRVLGVNKGFSGYRITGFFQDGELKKRCSQTYSIFTGDGLNGPGQWSYYFFLGYVGIRWRKGKKEVD